jgi:DNA-binding MarR family transcriptional regulator
MASRSKSPPTTPARRRPEVLGAEAAVVLRQFRQVFNAVKTHFQQVENKAGLGGAQVWALSVVKASPGLGVNDLARAMDIHQSTASNLIKGLAGRDMIEARRDDEDRRAVRLYLLPAGTKALRASPGPYTGVLPSALASLDAQTLLRLQHDLSILIKALHADKKGARIPLAGV